MDDPPSNDPLNQTALLCNTTTYGMKPIYKVHVHGNKRDTLYIFVGAAPQHADILSDVKSLDGNEALSLSAKQRKKLKHAYGENYVSRLGLDQNASKVVFMPHTLYHDDTVSTACLKLVAYIDELDNIDAFYGWYKRANMMSKERFANTFLDNLFYNRTFISVLELKKAVFDYTHRKLNADTLPSERIDRRGAFKLLSNMRFGFTYHALRFMTVYQYNETFIPCDPIKYKSISDYPAEMYHDFVDQSFKTLEALSPFKHTIHIATKSFLINRFDNAPRGMTELYFPKSLASKIVETKEVIALVKASDRMVDTIHDAVLSLEHDKYNIKCGVYNLHVRSNLSKLSKLYNIDLGHIMSHWAPTRACPFARYSSPDGMVYKLLKTAVPDVISEATLLNWIDVDGQATQVKNLQELLIFKAYLGADRGKPRFATIVMFPFGMYDVKFSFGLYDHVQAEDMGALFDIVNKIITQINDIQDIELPLLDRAFWRKGNVNTSTELVKFAVTTSIQTAELGARIAKLEALERVARGMTPFFSVVSIKDGILHLLYRRITEFVSPENIMSFIKKNKLVIKDKQELVNKVEAFFGINRAEALQHVNAASGAMKSDMMRVGNKVFYKFKSLTIANVRIKPGVTGYQVIMDGMSDSAYQKRILQALLVLVEDALHKKSKLGPDVFAKHDVHLDGVLNRMSNKHRDDDDGKSNNDSNNREDQDNDDDDAAAFGFDINGIDDLDMDMDQNEIDDVMRNFAFGDDDDDRASDNESAAINNGHEHDDGEEDDVAHVSSKKKGKSRDEDEQLDTSDKKNTKKLLNKYILNELLKADNDLFKPKKGPKDRYAKKCQMTINHAARQPVVIRPKELEAINKKYPGAVANHLAYGSTEEHAKKNIYVCPQVWCPISRVAMTSEQFEKAGEKCPGKNEFPVAYYKSPFFDGKKQYVKLMKFQDKDTFHDFCAPCCYKTAVKEGDNDCGDGVSSRTGKEVYIMKANKIPLDAKRYGLLPPVLSSLFENSEASCVTGHIKATTDCFLRVGIAAKRQSFLVCMASALRINGVTNDQELIDLIVSKMTVSEFLMVQDGVLCRRFTDDVHDVDNFKMFNKFKAWFVQQKTYIQSFNLAHIRDQLVKTSVFAHTVPFAKEIMREFIIYVSFHKFIAYMKDEMIIKTHDVLLGLFASPLKWINPSSYNIILFEVDNEARSRITCPLLFPAKATFNKERYTLFIIKQGAFYEPINHVSMSNSKAVIQEQFEFNINKRVQKVISYYLNQCKGTNDDVATKLYTLLQEMGETIQHHVLDYQFQVIGWVTKSGIFVPCRMPLPSPVDRIASGSISVMYFDHMYRVVKPAFTEAEATKLFDGLNKRLQDEYFKKDASVSKSGRWWVLDMGAQFKPVVLLKPMDASATSALLDDVKNDLNIFVRWTSSDPRKDTVDVTQGVQMMHTAFFNEVVYILGRDESIMETVQFMRHPSNPMPRGMKRQLLKDMLDKWIPRVMYKVTDTNIHTGRYQDTSCSLIKLRKGMMHEQCNGQCRVIEMASEDAGVMKRGRHCRLRVPEHIFNSLYARVLDDLVNPNKALSIQRINTDITVTSNQHVIVFTDQDVRQGRLRAILDSLADTSDSALGFAKEVVKFDTDLFNKVSQIEAPTTSNDADMLANIISHKDLDKVHSDYVKVLKGFYVSRNEEYNHNSMYKLMAAINNRINTQAKATAKTLRIQVAERIKEFVASDARLAVKEAVAGTKFTKTPSATEVLADADDLKSYPSYMHLRIMGELIGVGVIIIGRKKDPFIDTMRCLTRADDPSSIEYFVMLNHRNDSQRKVDKFEVIVKKKGNSEQLKYLLTKEDVDAEFFDLLKKKCKKYYIPSI